jgi:hypothetical protein
MSVALRRWLTGDGGAFANLFSYQTLVQDCHFITNQAIEGLIVLSFLPIHLFDCSAIQLHDDPFICLPVLAFYCQPARVPACLLPAHRSFC